MGLDEILKKVYEISKRYRETARISGANFNIFKILGVQVDELSHSRIIKTLLDPQGGHGQGDIFLKLFLVNILNREFSENELEGFKVIREHTTNFGRLDIWTLPHLVESIKRVAPS